MAMGLMNKSATVTVHGFDLEDYWPTRFIAGFSIIHEVDPATIQQSYQQCAPDRGFGLQGCATSFFSSVVLLSFLVSDRDG